MGRLRRTAALLACLIAALPHPASAQGEAPAPADAEARAPDELPDGVSFGPSILVPTRELTAEEQRRERARRYDATEPLMPTVFQLFVGAGAPLDSSLDAALAAHHYGDSLLMLQADATLLTRVADWIWLGGRAGMRGRGWGRNHGEPAVAGGIDALAIAHVRAHLGSIVDLGAVLGVGLGWGGTSIQGATAWAFAPRVSGAVQVGFRLAPGARIGARIGWDWFSMYDLDRYGSDLELGGPMLGIGFELRR